MGIPRLNIFKKIRALCRKPLTKDRISLELWGLHLSVERETRLDVPTELSIIIPRVEFRHSCQQQAPESCSTEIILNSITVVEAPRHPPESRNGQFVSTAPARLKHR